MSNYKNSQMHKSIMAEKGKQDADTASKKKPAAPVATSSDFNRKPGIIARGLQNARDRQKVGGNIVGAALDKFRK